MATFTEFKDKALIGLFTFIVGMMWYDIKEMKQDIKLLIINNSENKIRLDVLEKQSYKSTIYKSSHPQDVPPKKFIYNIFAINNKREEDELYNQNI